MTGGELSELGLNTRLSTVQPGSMILEMPRPPFNVDLEADNMEEGILGSDHD